MKFKVGDIICLNDGKTVYIFEIDEKEETYHVSDTEDENELHTVKEEEIYMKLI